MINVKFRKASRFGWYKFSVENAKKKAFGFGLSLGVFGIDFLVSIKAAK